MILGYEKGTERGGNIGKYTFILYMSTNGQFRNKEINQNTRIYSIVK
jgi:hypothetical protein